MTTDERRRWLQGDPTATPPKDPDAVLGEVERDHCHSILLEHGRDHVRVLHQSPQSPVSPAVVPRRVDAPSPCSVPVLLDMYKRVVVVGGRGAGKTALVAHLAVQAAHEAARSATAFIPFIVPVRLLSQPWLDERTIAELSPIGSVALIRKALAKRRALVLVDGLDEAGDGTTVLSESIHAFVEAHPDSHVVVTTRPRRTGIPGFARVDLPGFVTAGLLPPPGSRVYAAHRFLQRRSPERRASLVREQIDALLRRWGPPELPDGSVLGRLELQEKRILFGNIAARMHHGRVVELPAEALATFLRDRLHEVRCTAGDHLILDKQGEREEERYTLAEKLRVRAARALEMKERMKESEEFYSDQDFADWADALDDDPPPESDPAPAPAQPQEGEVVEDVEGLAEGIVREIRQRPGLLLERKPGFFGFAELVFQECLTAQQSIRDSSVCDFAEYRTDPWWHDVIVLAAAAPEAEAAELIEDILSSDGAEAAAATFIAARCVEVARERLPAGLLRTVARRLSELVPPDNLINAEHLLEVGEVACPALIQALGSADPTQRAHTANILGKLRYAPAHGALIRMASDAAPTDDEILCPIWTADVFFMNRPVACFALAALFNMALTSTASRRAFEQALERVDPTALRLIHRFADRCHLLDAPGRDTDLAGVLLVKMERVLARHAGKKDPGRRGR